VRRPAADDFFAWVERFTIPHHAREAMWHLILSGPPALDAVRAGLAHDDPAVRLGCTQVLDHLVDDAALADLVEMVTDDDADVRVFALHALSCDRCKENGCSPDVRFVLPAAIDRLRHDEDRHVRAHAVGVVGQYSTSAPRRSTPRSPRSATTPIRWCGRRRAGSCPVARSTSARSRRSAGRGRADRWISARGAPLRRRRPRPW
jgi:hypothetical protein